jgi:DNA-binding IclR family transcriptional regulator
MEGLAKSTAETIDLSTVKGKSAVFLDQVLGSLRLLAVSRIGDRFPLHCTANGKALLALMPQSKRAKLLANGLEPHTERTIVDPQRLEEELKSIQATGIAYDLEEHTAGICAVGAAQVDPLGRLYAISIPIPTARFAAKREKVAQQLAAANREFGIAINGVS